MARVCATNNTDYIFPTKLTLHLGQTFFTETLLSFFYPRIPLTLALISFPTVPTPLQLLVYQIFHSNLLKVRFSRGIPG